MATKNLLNSLTISLDKVTEDPFRSRLGMLELFDFGISSFRSAHMDLISSALI